MLEGPWSQGSLSTDVSYFVPCSSSKGLGHKEELLMPNSVLLHLHSFSLSRLNKVFWNCHSCTLYPSFNDFTDGWRGAWQEMDKCHRRGKGRAEHMQGSTATQGQQHPSCHLRPGLQGWDGWRKNEIRVGKKQLRVGFLLGTRLEWRKEVQGQQKGGSRNGRHSNSRCNWH